MDLYDTNLHEFLSQERNWIMDFFRVNNFVRIGMYEFDFHLISYNSYDTNSYTPLFLVIQERMARILYKFV